MTITLIAWTISVILGALIGGLLRQNPVAGFMLGLAFGPLGVVLAYFLEDDAAAEPGGLGHG